MNVYNFWPYWADRSVVPFLGVNRCLFGDSLLMGVIGRYDPNQHHPDHPGDLDLGCQDRRVQGSLARLGNACARSSVGAAAHGYD
jgi:hypothetical protein